MYARVARFEGAGSEELEETAARIQQDSESGPPEGVPGKKFLLLTDAENGRAIGIGFFESEDDYRKGDETLNQMSPPGEGMRRRVAVEKYEVALETDF